MPILVPISNKKARYDNFDTHVSETGLAATKPTDQFLSEGNQLTAPMACPLLNLPQKMLQKTPSSDSLQSFNSSLEKLRGEELVTFLEKPESRVFLEDRETLDLSAKLLRDCDFRKILEIFEEFDVAHLKSLDLSRNQISRISASLMADSECMENLESLNLSNNEMIGRGGVIAIVSSEYMSQLKSLNLHNCYFGDEGVQAIANSEFMTNLEELDLSGDAFYMNEVSSVGVQAIAASPFLAQLKNLSLNGNAIGPEGVLAITTSDYLKNITSLNLCNCDIESDSIVAIANSPNMKNLEDLKFDCQDILTEDRINKLAYSPYIKKLKSLSVAPIDRQSAVCMIKSIVGSEQMQSLRRIDIVSCQLESADVGMIANSENMQNITHLNLSWNNIGDDGVRAIARSEYMKNLTSLNLGRQNDEHVSPLQGNHMTAECAKLIAGSVYMQNLTELLLGFNPISDEGVYALINSPYMKNIKFLDLAKCGIQRNCIMALVKAEYMQNIEKLDLAFNKLEHDILSFIWSLHEKNDWLPNLKKIEHGEY